MINSRKISLIKSPGLMQYLPAIEWMKNRVEAVISKKAPQTIWFLEHPSLYTAGTGAINADLLKESLPVYQANRGGKYTYHGPGQRVVYLILNLWLLHEGQPDIKRFVFDVEEWVIRALERFKVMGKRKKGLIGVWIEDARGDKKIAAIGVRIKKWVTYHGVAINIDPDLNHFQDIIPCGISEFGVTSLSELGKQITIESLDEILINEFIRLFNCIIEDEERNP